MKRFLILFAALALSGCNLDVAQPQDAPSDPSNPRTETFAPGLHIDIASMDTTKSGAFYKDVQVGTGATMSGNANVIMSYLGLLKNANTFAAGSSELIDVATLVTGLQEGLQGMRAGGERIIVVPSALGYGSIRTATVPPNSTLVWDIKLIDVQ